MSERTEYKPGTPSWVDHSSSDPAAAADFYGKVFGWDTEDGMPNDADGQYFMATLRGKNVAALGSNPVEGVPPHWNTYITVESADDAAAAVKEAGVVRHDFRRLPTRLPSCNRRRTARPRCPVRAVRTGAYGRSQRDHD